MNDLTILFLKAFQNAFQGHVSTLLVIFEICLELVPGGFKNVMSVLLLCLGT